MDRADSGHRQDFYQAMNDLFHGVRTVEQLAPWELRLRSSLGETLLHYLAVESRAELVDQLAKAGIGVDEPSEWSTPLEDAVSVGATECVRVLLRRGADPNQKEHIDENPLIVVAAERGNWEMYMIFLEAGADPDVASCESWDLDHLRMDLLIEDLEVEELDLEDEFERLRPKTAREMAAAYRVECLTGIVRVLDGWRASRVSVTLANV